MKRCLIWVVLLALLCTLTACNGVDGSLVGKWEDTDDGTAYGFVFEEDGEGMIYRGKDYRPISWHTTKGKLTVEASGVTVMNEAEYFLENELLAITYDDSTVIFVKKK